MKTTIKKLLLSLTLISASTLAHANWWDQGAEMLKQSNILNSDSASKTTSSSSPFSNTELESAFREALSTGSKTVVEKLSLENAFNQDSNIHIPLPSGLQSVKSGLSKVGMASYMDNLETTLNRAAEAAMPETKSVFLEAIQKMTFADVKKIYSGGNNAATDYLQNTTTDSLKTKIAPIVNSALQEVGAVNAYDSLTTEYRKKYPFLPNLKADLQSHVTDKAIEGIFFYLAKEEADIRANPVKYGSDLLTKIFSKN